MQDWKSRLLLKLIAVPGVCFAAGPAPAQDPGAGLDDLGLSEVAMVTLGVADLERSTAFYRDAFGFVVAGNGRVAADGPLAAAWLLPAGVSVEFRIVGPANARTGLLRLAAFSAPGRQIWGSYATPADLGLYAVNLRVADMQAAWPRMQAAGGKPRSNPHTWDVLPGVTAHDSQYFDPDGTLLDVFELTGNAVETTFGTLADGTSPVQTVAIHTADADRSKAFYLGLGFEEYYDKVLTGLEGLLKVPTGTSIRNVNLIKFRLSPNGRIELAQYIGIPGTTQRDAAVPPNHGILRLSFQTADLDATADLLHALGAEPAGAEARANLAPFGPVRLRSWYGPDGEVLEFFQRD